MKRYLAPLAVLVLVACSAPKYVYKGVHDGVELSYRWNHPAGKPSELLLKMTNTAAEDKQIGLVLDLYYQGRTVESFEADTCLKVGQTMNGKLNCFFFIPQRLTTEQIKSGDGKVEMTSTSIVPAVCP
jgi:hypothetical protein